jgi:hypothetical protein
MKEVLNSQFFTMFYSLIIYFLRVFNRPKLQSPFALNGVFTRSLDVQIFFESRDPEGAQMRDVAVRRLRFVMRRISWLVPRATVHLSDVNGPRGGIDKRCQLELKTHTAGVVVVTSTAHDWRGALDGALARASRALTHSFKRNHPKNRTSAKHQVAATSEQQHHGLSFDG